MADLPDTGNVVRLLLSGGSPKILAIMNKLGGPAAFLDAAPDIIALAKLWNQLNAEHPDEAVPNAYGMKAFAEIKARQREFGFEGNDVDGIIGDQTWREINKRLKMLEQAQADKTKPKT